MKGVYVCFLHSLNGENTQKYVENKRPIRATMHVEHGGCWECNFFYYWIDASAASLHSDSHTINKYQRRKGRENKCYSIEWRFVDKRTRMCCNEQIFSETGRQTLLGIARKSRGSACSSHKLVLFNSTFVIKVHSVQCRRFVCNYEQMRQGRVAVARIGSVWHVVRLSFNDSLTLNFI